MFRRIGKALIDPERGLFVVLLFVSVYVITILLPSPIQSFTFLCSFAGGVATAVISGKLLRRKVARQVAAEWAERRPPGLLFSMEQVEVEGEKFRAHLHHVVELVPTQAAVLALRTAAANLEDEARAKAQQQN